MANRDKDHYKGDLTKFSTKGMTGSTSSERVAAAREQARPAPAAPYDPAKHAKVGAEIVDRSKRAVMGNYERKGRAPMHVLTPTQFTSFQQTGQWEGMPTPEQYGPQNYAPDDKEYTKL